MTEAVSEDKQSIAAPNGIPASWSHRCFTLVGSTFLIFEFIFVSLYGSDSWFGMDISGLGVPAILASLFISHYFLRFQESPYGCHFFSPIWKGRPPIVYWNLVKLGKEELQYGGKYIKLSVIDELFLSFLGNLVIRSRAVCGNIPKQADELCKLPLGAASPESQKAFIELLRSYKPQLITNKRLEKRLATKVLPGQTFVQCFGALFMVVILFDLGASTFAFLEMNKEYYLSMIDSRTGKMDTAIRHFEAAEKINDRPFPYSWVNNKLLRQGVVAAGVHQLRSETLWDLGRKQDSIDEARKAVETAPDNFRMYLRLARILADNGDMVGSRAAIRQAIKHHKDSLLPRLYMLAELAGMQKPAQAERFYQLYLDELHDLVFGDEPWWPPGGNRFLHEVFYSDDVTFVFDRLLSTKHKDQPRSAE